MSNIVETIQFRGVKIRYFDERREGETGLFTRIHLTADPSDPVFEVMDWDTIPDCVGSGKLLGSLVGSGPRADAGRSAVASGKPFSSPASRSPTLCLRE